jgi:hypothetical protein
VVKRLGIGMAVTMAVTVTLALGVAAVWVSGDARAAGVVVMIAGLLAAAPFVKDELHTKPVSDTVVGNEQHRPASWLDATS